MNFVAIDVETANADCSSICQIGIVKILNGVVVDEWKSYIDPEDIFNNINSHIHGISYHQVKDAPKLNQIADHLNGYLDKTITICHTHFDRVALQQAYDKYGLIIPDITWLDTARVARRTWSKYAWSGYGLSNICKDLEYKYQSHDALEDAKAAAFVLLKAIEVSGITLEEWLNKVNRRIGYEKTHKSEYHKLNNKVEANPDGHLFGTNIVFTGALTMNRPLAVSLASEAGCIVQNNVTRDTNLLVVGMQDTKRLGGKTVSNKQLRAEELIIKGQEIQIIGESDFLKLVNQSNY
jgi:DNA polymerase III subunit epsilon